MRTSRRYFRTISRSYIVFLFVFSFFCWAMISLSTSSLDTLINLHLELSLKSRQFRFQLGSLAILEKFCRNKGTDLKSHNDCDLFTCEDSVLFLRIRISTFRAKAHLVFYWCLYNKFILYLNNILETCAEPWLYLSLLAAFLKEIVLSSDIERFPNAFLKKENNI